MISSKILVPVEKDLGEFKVRRLLPAGGQRSVGPFVFFDHMGPASFSPGQWISVRPHPHIHLATVTYLFTGEIHHRDSLGSDQLITPGAINLMIAGRGIVHSEREREQVKQSHHELHGIQLWMAVPAEFEEVDPEFHHYPASAIPETQVSEGVTARVMMGSILGMTSPVKTLSPTVYCEIHFSKQDRIQISRSELPDEFAVYFVDTHGQLTVNAEILEPFHMWVGSNSDDLELKATRGVRLAVIGGSNLGPRWMEWNFVSSKKESIEEAKRAWKAGQFAKVPGDETEFIPLP